MMTTSLSTVLRRTIGPTNLRLLGLLAALSIVFGAFVGDRLFGEFGLRSMAYQLPELGLLSLAMMVALLSGGLDLSIIATANLAALTTAAVLKAAPVRRRRAGACRHRRRRRRWPASRSRRSWG